MAKVTLVIGLCGSGKTYLSEQLAQQTGAELFESLVEQQVVEVPRLLESLKAGKNCVVEEISFCTPEGREWIMRRIRNEVPDIQVEWNCYENDLDAANHNVRQRKNKGEPHRHIEINERVSSQYTYPEGCTLVKIFRLPLPQ